jgi:hypothetical protein
MASTQTYTNHRRFFAPWHFFVAPVLFINIIVVAKRAISGPAIGTAWNVLVAIALFVGILLSRVMPLRAQDRIIRLEEKTRIRGLLPAEMRGREDGLTREQYIALRFAPDDEVPELLRRIHAGELKTSADIKRAIKNWRSDDLRV